MKGILLQVCVAAMLASVALCTVTITSNASTVSANCVGSPFFKLNLCNISCSTCTSSSHL